MPSGHYFLWRICLGMVVLGVLLSCSQRHARADQSAELFVLMHHAGKIERYEPATGKHLGTFISGLPPANAISYAPDGCWLITTGKPGEVGSLLRFDPRNGGSLKPFIDIPEGYGGRLFRPTGMAWWDGRLLVASQIDGKVKCYEYPSGQWLGDVATASPGSITQIALAGSALLITDYSGQAVRRVNLQVAVPANAIVSENWAQHAQQSPWGVAVDTDGHVFWSTATNQIYRSTQSPEGAIETTLWANTNLATPFSLMIGPDHRLYCASLSGPVSVWRTDDKLTEPLLLLHGPEVQGPASIVLAPAASTPKFLAPSIDALAETDEKLAFFENKIRPILHEHCLECHGAEVQEARLRLDSRLGWETGGRSGRAVIPGKPESSLLVQAVSHLDKDLKMPPQQRLSLTEIELLTQWVSTGAIDPRRDQAKAEEPTADSWAEEFQQRLDWWSLKPMRLEQPPKLTDDQWSAQPVDRFVLARLRAASLHPAPVASDEVLARRLSQVLTGLPLPPETLTEYLQNAAQDADVAYTQLVDQLLESPHFGERMARHWMDVVRYTDTYGYEWDNPAKGSHEYRDYLVRAFNQDLPYTDFVREQLAGDLLPEPRIDAALGINESIIGPMFYHLGEHRHGSSLAFNGVHQEMMNNKIDAFSKVFLATTVACARCHDHKREAVSQRDYYALGAVFMTPRWVSRPADAPGKNAAAIERLKELRQQLHSELAKQWTGFQVSGAQLAQVVAKLKSLEKPPQPGLKDVLYPLWKLYALPADGDWSQAWSALAQEYAAARAARLEQNKSIQILSDLASNQLPDGWVMEGEGFQSGWAEAGTPLVALEGDRAITQLLPRGLHTHALSSKLPGVVRMPPQHTVPKQFTSLLLAGGQYSGSLVLDENSFQNETVTFFQDREPTWRSYADAALKNGVMRVTIDFATSSLNANFPPRVGLSAGLPPSDMGFDKRSWLSLCGIAVHDTAAAPQDTLDHFIDLYELQSTPPLSATPARCEIEARLGHWLSAAVERWNQQQSRASDVPLINFLLDQSLLPNQREISAEVRDIVDQYRLVESTIEFPRTVNSMDERLVSKSGVYFNVRGNVDAMGELVMPDGLQMFAGRNRIAQDGGSGRLQLAESLLDPEHPLTARVYVNRVWQWIFGQGLVGTPDDFGRLGEQPSHPELLDWLARNFVAEGWSTKRLVRMLVLSQTFKQAGQTRPVAMQVDPANRWLHHFATRRMEAEEIRDALLAVSGKLDRRLYGRPINPPRSVEDETKRLFSGPVDGHGRRSLYLTMSIMAPPKFLTTFDLPDLKLPSGRRNVTNVPAQALQLLNDPLVVQQAKHWVQALMAQPCSRPEQRLDTMFLTAYGRRPRPEEYVLWMDYLTSVAETEGQGQDLLQAPAAWNQVAHAIFNTKEFIYYR